MNVNKFLTLLIGECWHEWRESKEDWATVICQKCGVTSNRLDDLYGFHPDHLSNPLPVLRWMREKMPEEWEEYLLHIFSTTWTLKLSDDLFRILDLSNLVKYLLDHPEWAYVDCPNLDLDDYVCRNFSPECECELGRIVHPALKYAKEE